MTTRFGLTMRVFALLCALSLPSCAPVTTGGPVPDGFATRVIHGGRIYTANDSDAFVSAMAMRDDEILYVGDDAGADAFIHDNTVVEDLRGRVVLPGLHDVHQHTLEAHLPVISCILDPAELDAEAFVADVRRCRTARGTDWVLGWGHSLYALLDTTRAPRLILDDAISDRPVAIMEETSHSTWVNSRALEVLGIDANTPDPQGGIIVRDTTGAATGLLIDAAGEYPWDAALQPNAALQAANVDALRDAMQHNNSVGITSAVDARTYVGRGYLDAYETLEAEDALTVRMVLSLWASPVADDDAQIAELASLFRDDDGMVRVRQIKFYSDGILHNTTAALLDPYVTEPLGAATGLNYFPPARLERYVRALQAVGFDAHIHAIGDRAIREALDVVAATAADAGGASAHHRLTHVELTHPNEVARFAALGVSADMQLGEHTHPSHLSETAELVGMSRVDERAWVLRDLWDAGANVTLSSDYDVGALSPFSGIAAAIDRGPQSLPSVAAAVRAYAINAARVMRSEHRTGSLEVGKTADYVVIDRDIFAAGADIAATRVVMTVLGGRTVYRP